VYTKQDWFALVERINQLPTLSDVNVRNFQRFFIGSAIEGEVSRQGRISIPQNLREFAGLDREIVVVGLSNKIEIWAKEKYEEFTANVDQSAPGIADAIKGFGV
jgi:MraZ protein